MIFIDDLDRCRPPHSADVLGAINQLLDQPDVVVVIMSDMQVVAKCAEVKYRDLAIPETPTAATSPPLFSTYGWSFLQKIIQLQFDLPIYPVRMIRQMVEALARGATAEKTVGWWPAFWKDLQVRVRRVSTGLFWARVWRVMAWVIGILLLCPLFFVPSIAKIFPFQIGWVEGARVMSGWAGGIWIDWPRESTNGCVNQATQTH